MIAWPAKDPADIADFIWTPDLDVGDTIASFTATITSGTITKQASETYSDTQGIVWFQGGADQELAMISLTVTTAGGRTFKEGAVLPVFSRATETLATFRLRYPAFAGVSDGLISYRLYEALTAVGTSWPEANRIIARTAHAAHKLAEAGALSGGVPQGVTSFKSGTFSASISDTNANRIGLDSTIYGREFVTMRRTAFAGPRLSWTPPVAD